MLMLSQDVSVIVNSGISAPVHSREVVDVIIFIEIMLLLQLIPTVQLPSAKGYDT